jgi:hypothetical protein
MSPLGTHRRGSAKADFNILMFGGWGDYQEWAEHDFLPRPGFDGTVAGESAAVDVAASMEPPTIEPPTIEIIEAVAPPAEEDAPPYADLESAEVDDLGSSAELAELVVRPYVRTGGRAASRYDLRLETMVVTKKPRMEALPADRPLEFSDIGRICSLCEVPLSVAELSAYLRAPLGVVRVLVGDAINQGLVLVQENESDTDGCPSMHVLRRVYEGLCKLP